MTLTKLLKPILVDDPQKLASLIQTLSCNILVAVDSEANSLYAYKERVCLIQFSIPGKDFLVDPILVDDLSPLRSVFDNPKIEKIFHAAEYDILLMKQDLDFSFVNIFDTMVAARILGRDSVGLSSILNIEFNIAVDKKYQRANWGRRPLPDEMLTYAQIDTHYLIPLRNRLKSELISKGLWELAQEDFQRGSQVEVRDRGSKSMSCWRIQGIQDLNKHQQAVLHELCQFRERVAEDVDRPLFKVIHDNALLRIAMEMPVSVKMLEQIHCVSKKQVRWLGKGIISAVKRGMHKNPPGQPKTKRPDDDHLDRIKNLRKWRKNKAQKWNVESDVILPKDLLLKLASKNPETYDELEQTLHMVPWRLDKFGPEIFDLLRKI